MKTLITIWIILGIICAVIEFIKEHISLAIGIVLIVLSIVVIRALLPIIAPLIPYIILMLMIYIIVRAMINSAMKKKAYSYLEWLGDVGIGKPKITPEYKKVFKWLKKQGYIEPFLWSDYIISVKFYEEIMSYFNQKQEILDSEFQNICLSIAPRFCIEYTETLLDFLQRKKFIFQFSPVGEEKHHYISTNILKECEQMFEIQGAATEDEFTEICGKILTTPYLRKKRSRLARDVLQDMYSRGVVEIVDLKDMDLYIAKNQKQNSKMKKVIINMDV